MDGSQFDRLTKVLAGGVSRRRVVRGGLGSLIGAALAALGRGAAAAPSTCSVYCADQPGARKAACKQACRQCGGDPAQVCHNDETGEFACCPAGQGCFGGICCASPDQVCFGANGPVCCAEGTFCNGNTGTCEPPAVCDATSGCLGGTCAAGCFCVSTVEGEGACVSGAFADCFAPSCSASSDCGGGVCVDATDCCGFATLVCFPPEGICQTGGTGGTTSSATALGWNR
jgi:hypothetical protein